ncbi:MAG: ABC transporter ATP-binding protein [Thermonema sp.]|uniref:ABC transporter ATP-binding protein n=1 Tax=Thermonema sp. TaxID=2231181 RepID=UPI0021DF074C|nr:ABC transporter ATP-binding protein [Thermonema sp.]GIV38772.1 MAG: ABC transporter ATP-binding protein [Thermonema sp.]
MSNIVLSVENVWKQYRLGVIGVSSLREEIERFWAKIKGKEAPLFKVGETNDRQNIRGRYVWALQDINFEVKQGQVVGIIGENGAGKSTLLKILSKVTPPTKGIIRIKGRIASLLEVGTGFHPELTGRENIFLNGAILGMTKNDIRKKFDEIVEFSGIGKYVDTPVKRYSSGMYVRLAFAVAAHLEPEILIVDEVLSVGDAEFQKRCLGKMQDVSSEGRTVLFVSHNMAAVHSLCSYGILMNQGKVKFQGNIDVAIKNYLNQVTIKNDNKTQIEKLLKLQDEFIEIISLKLFQKSVGDLLDNAFDSGEDICLQFVYRVKKEVIGLRIGFELQTLEGLIIFRSFHDDRHEELETIKAGTYCALARIPANFLSPKEYIINIAIGIHNYRWIVYNDCKLTICSSGVPTFNKPYGYIHEGVLMPLINWDYTPL